VAKTLHEITEWIPPALLRAVRRVRGGGLRFSGRYASWQEAQKVTGGYAAAGIIDKAFDSARAVALGEAIFERDGVTFDEPEFPFEVLACLLRTALEIDRPLNVIDFGGAFGTTYRHFAAFAPSVRCRWRVVEQAEFVVRGRKSFQDGSLEFCFDIREAYDNFKPDVLLFSGVVPYVERPYELLALVADLQWRMLIVSRNNAAERAHDSITVQHVPPSIYDATYPCWIMSRPRLHEELLRVAGPTGHVFCTWKDSNEVWRDDEGRFFQWGAAVLREPTTVDASSGLAAGQ
jgi:putative methyltransferase (TIGR04325 family)